MTFGGYRDITVGGLLSALARDHGEREALVYPDRNLRLTFAQLEERVNRMARGLISLGIGPSERVAVWGPNVPDWIYLQFALAKIGAVLVTVNTALQTRELQYLLEQSECCALFHTATFRDRSYLETVAALEREKLPHLRLVEIMDSPEFNALLSDLAAEELLEERSRAVALDQVINMQYTSGTTGFPKGVMLSSRNIVNNADCIAEGLGFTPEDRLLMPVPLFHCFGCVISVLGCFTRAACLVPLEAFDPLDALRLVEGEKCTALHGVPTMFVAELEHPRFSEFDLSSLRTGIMAGSMCPESLMRRVMQEMHLTEITIAYGLTETSPAISLTPRDDSVALRTQTVGKVLPQVEVKVVEPGGHDPLPPGHKGELCARGSNVMLGYYNQPEATAAVLSEDGWLRTGDQATVDEDGYIRITGRIKDIIISGGENISPAEVEEVLRQHPAVVDLCVFGIADPRFVEAVALAVRLRPGHQLDRDALKSFCQGKLAPFKIPAHIFEVSEFPLTASGKIQRFRLRELYGATKAK